MQCHLRPTQEARFCYDRGGVFLWLSKLSSYLNSLGYLDQLFRIACGVLLYFNFTSIIDIISLTRDLFF